MIKRNDFIKKYWQKNARKFKESHWASWGDNFVIDLEISNIAPYIKKNYRVLEAGCGNGFSTFKLYFLKKTKEIFGIDLVEEMIFYANKRKKREKLGKKIQFRVGDIRRLDFKNNYFDVVYTTRVLINLSNWQEQQQAINECLRVTKKGGKVLFSEAFWEPLVLLNALRALKQLPSLVEHDFNRYLKKEKLASYLKKKKLKFKVVDFSSIYYLGSRFLRELVTNPKGYSGYSNPINKIFYEIEKKYSGGGFGIQQLYVITKT